MPAPFTMPNIIAESFANTPTTTPSMAESIAAMTTTRTTSAQLAPIAPFIASDATPITEARIIPNSHLATSTSAERTGVTRIAISVPCSFSSTMLEPGTNNPAMTSA